MRKRVLVVEDDAALGRILCDNFEIDGFDVTWVTNSDLALDKARELAPDLVVLDIMLPGSANGFDLCGILRQGGRTPIMIVTAKSQTQDKLTGLNLGADDYVTKPFDLQELLARAHAILRRARPTVDCLTLGNVVVDFRGKTARCGRQPIHLTYRELEVLRYLAERPGVVVFRDELLREVWGYPEAPTTRSVDHAIARLRKKIEPDSHIPRFIHTVHGDGYSLTPAGSRRSPSHS